MHLSGAPEGGKPHPRCRNRPRWRAPGFASCLRFLPPAPQRWAPAPARPGHLRLAGPPRARAARASLPQLDAELSGTARMRSRDRAPGARAGHLPCAAWAPGAGRARPHRGLPRARPWGHPGGPGSRNCALSPGVPGGPCTRRPSVVRHRGQKGRRKSGAGRQVPGLGETPRRHFRGCGLSSPVWKMGSCTIGLAGGTVNGRFACSTAAATATSVTSTFSRGTRPPPPSPWPGGWSAEDPE